MAFYYEDEKLGQGKVDLSDTVAKNQGTENKGKILLVGNDGNVTTGDSPSGVEVIDITKADYEKLTDDEVKGKFFNTTDEADIDLSAYAKISALGTQCTFSLSGTTLTITPKK